jgi:hypothetical protein
MNLFDLNESHTSFHQFGLKLRYAIVNEITSYKIHERANGGIVRIAHMRNTIQ